MSTAARARRDLYAASAALLRDCLRCNGFAISCKTLPTSATRISGARTFSRSFPVSSRGSNGSSSLPLASISADLACRPTSPRTRLRARCLPAVISIRAFSAICVRLARAWTSILLLVVKKTDSAGWLEVLLPWSWNPLREQARLFIGYSSESSSCAASKVFAGGRRWRSSKVNSQNQFGANGASLASVKRRKQATY